MSQIHITGRKNPKRGRKTKSFAKGRVCSENGCEQVLSIYNDNKQCFLHAPAKPPRTRGWTSPENKK